jgi:hypothetical protein
MNLVETEMIFRTYKDGEVVALMPYECYDRSGHCMMAAMSGHGGADYLGVMKKTKPSTEEELQPLKTVLKGMYNIKTITRANPTKRTKAMLECGGTY